ncbi:chaperonin [Selenomonas sp.]|uniref:chaperonin n=1 Tax=Selenomonas sp. TaxID=2053611 RepID=UPI003FA2E7BE
MELKFTGYDRWDLSVRKEVLYEFAWSLQSAIERACSEQERETKYPFLNALYERSIKDAGRLLVTDDPIEVLNIEGRLDHLQTMLPLLKDLKR